MSNLEKINLLKKKYNSINVIIKECAKKNNVREFQSAIHTRNIISREILQLKNLIQ